MTASRQCSPLVRIVKTHQQIDHRGLTTAGRSNDCHTLCPGITFKFRIFDQFLLRADKKNTYMLHTQHCRLRPSEHNCILPASACLRLLLDQFKDACPHRPMAFCSSVIDAGNLIKRLGILVCIVQETGQLSDRSFVPLHGCQSSRNSHSRVHQTVYKAGGRVGDRGIRRSPAGNISEDGR